MGFASPVSAFLARGLRTGLASAGAASALGLRPGFFFGAGVSVSAAAGWADFFAGALRGFWEAPSFSWDSSLAARGPALRS